MKHYATTIKNAHRAKRYAKIRAALMSALMTIGVLFCTGITAFAEGAAAGENAAPTGVGGSNTKSTMISVIFWIVRGGIGIAALAGIWKAVQAQADEDPRGRNNALTTVAVAAFGFAATFAIEALI